MEQKKLKGLKTVLFAITATLTLWLILLMVQPQKSSISQANGSEPLIRTYQYGVISYNGPSGPLLTECRQANLTVQVWADSVSLSLSSDTLSGRVLFVSEAGEMVCEGERGPFLLLPINEPGQPPMLAVNYNELIFIYAPTCQQIQKLLNQVNRNEIPS